MSQKGHSVIGKTFCLVLLVLSSKNHKTKNCFGPPDLLIHTTEERKTARCGSLQSLTLSDLALLK